jgi:hypothetical protein
VFALFHVHFFKLPVTAALGVVLAYLCWESRSIWPAVIAHILHNSITAALAAVPRLADALGVDTADTTSHLPLHLSVPGILLVAAALYAIGHRGGNPPAKAAA